MQGSDAKDCYRYLSGFRPLVTLPEPAEIFSGNAKRLFARRPSLGQS